MRFEKFHFVDYLSMGLLISLLFFTIFSSSYLSSKKTVNTKAYECNCHDVTDLSNCITPTTETQTDCRTDEDGNEICTDYQYATGGCDEYGTKQVCEECSDETPDVTPEVTPDVTPDVTPEVTPDVTPDVMPDVTPEVTTEPCTPSCEDKCGGERNTCNTGTCDAVCSTLSNCGEYGGSCKTGDCPTGFRPLNGGTCSGSDTCCYAGNALVDSYLDSLPATSNCTGYQGECASACATGWTALNGGTCAISGDQCCLQNSSIRNLINSNTAPGTSSNAVNSAINSALSNLTTALLRGITSSTGTSTNYPTTAPTSIPLATGVPTSSPTPTPAGKTVNLNMKLKFQGINSKPAGSSSTMDVKVTIYNTLATTTARRSMVASGTFSANDSGVWTGTVTFPSAYPGDGYYILVKGPRHLQRKICSLTPTESETSGSGCSGTFTIQEGNNSVDMTGVTMLVGDVNQDHSINSVDLGFIKSRLGKLDYSSLQIADLNLDGVINSLDYSMVIQAWIMNDVDQN